MLRLTMLAENVVWKLNKTFIELIYVMSKVAEVCVPYLSRAHRL